MLAANHALLSSTANGTTTTSTTTSSNNNNNDGEHDPADHLTRQPFPPLTLSDFDFFSAAAASAANHRPSYTMSDGADSHNLLLNTSATTTTTSSASVDFLKHRKSSDIDDSSLNLPASPLATTATADELGGASPSLLTEEQMITASQIAAELSARNKRKNFQPRNCAGKEEDKKKEEEEEGIEAEQCEDLGSDNLSRKTTTEDRHQTPTSSPSAKTSPPPPPPETSSPPSTMAESVLSDFVNPITTTSNTTTSSTLTSITANTARTATTSSQQPLDLSAAEQLEHQQQQQQQKLTEQLLFLKNIRDLSLFYPQLSPHALMAQLQQQPSLLEDSVSAAAAAAVSSVKDDAPGSPQPPPALSETLEPPPPPPSSSEVEQPQQQSNSSPIEQLLQLYNRDLYLKALQQQQNQGGGGIQRKEDDEEGEEGEGEESDDQGSQSELAASALNHHQPSSNRRTAAESGELITNENNEEDGEHECDGDDDLMTSIEDSGPNKTGDKVLSTKNSSSKANSIDIEKLKQLQELNKLLLLQQQIEQQQNSDLQNHNKQHQISSPLDSLTLDPTALFSSLDQQFHQQQQKSFPSSSGALLMKMKAAAAVTSSDAYNFGDIFKSKPSSNSGGSGQGGGNGGNKPSRRPLSSWKQSISACGPGPAPWVDKATLHSLGIPDELINNAVQIDYTNYVKRYGNAAECGNALCGELNYREHFHCNAASCNSRVFMKKEEMIRHFKWHKKRDESLTHGFLRCSPADNCVERFRACPHHRKQTHYHCLKRGCDKVYISTSDVQMHANYHRKDTAIIQEGFQRFRATENCLLETCAFFGQKTTHFHCRRDNCNHTFKNKADMEKHKSYHVRDETLARDGFKKFMKQEPCSFEDCRSSRVCNHIHCIRPGCAHVLHSTGQLYAHRRKHERREHELAYRKYRLAQVVHGRGGGSGSTQDLVHESFDHLPDDDSTLDTLAAQLPLAQVAAIPIEDILGEIDESRYLKHIQRHSCGSHQCHFELSTNSLDEHYCCAACSLCWLEVQHAVEHAKKHVLQEETTRLLLEETADVNVCPAECPLNSPKMRHLHCRMFGCTFALPLADRSLRKFEHYKFHEEQQRIFVASQEAACQRNSAAAASSSSLNYHPHLHQHRSSPLAGFTNHHHHHQQQQRPLLENSGSGSSSGNMEHLVKMKAAAAAAVAAAAASAASFSPTSSAGASRQSGGGHSKSTLEGKSSSASGGGKPPRSPPTLQVFPTGTTLTSVDGLPVLKRKRGRPPKNRVSELLSNMNSSRSSNSMKNNHTSVNNSSSSSRNPFAAALSGQNQLSSFDLAAAFNLPLKHANAISALHSNSTSSTGRGVSGHCGGEDDLSKTIPIPLIMPYLRSSIHHGFYVFDEETPCPDLSCVFFGGRHYHCSKPRCYYTVNREEVLLLHSRDFHENIDIMEGFVYFDEHIDCKLPSCPSNRAAKHFHCTRVGCGFSFVHYSLMCAHEDQHRLEAEAAAAAAAAAAASSSRFKRRKYNSDDDDDEEEEEGEEDDQEDADEDDGDRQFLLNNVGNHRGQQGSDQQQRLSEDFYAMLKSGGGGGGGGASSRGRQMNEQQLSSEEQQQQQQLMMMMAATGGGGGGGDHPLIKGNNHHQHDQQQQQQQQMSVMHSIQSYFQEQAKMNALNACLAGLNSHQGGGQVTGTTSTANNSSSSTLQHQLYNELNPCNSPFCKLKRKSHFHCNTCNQAFSSFERLVPHTMKRHGLPPPVPVYGGEGTTARQLSSTNNNSAEDHHNMGATGKQQLLLSSGDQPMFEHSLVEGSEEDGGAGASAEEQQQHSLLVASLQSQFAANPNLAGHFLQILMSNLMNSGAGGGAGAGAQQQQQQQQLMGGGGSSGSSSGLPSTSASPTLGLQTMGALPTNSGLSASAAFQQLAPTSPLYSNTPESLTAFPGRRDGSLSSDDGGGGNGSNASAIVADSSLFQKISQLTGQTQQKQKTPKTQKTLHQSSSSGSGSGSSIKSATTGDEECSSSASSTSNGGGDGGQHLLHNNNNNNNQLKKSSNLNTPTTTTSSNSFSEEPSPKGYLRFRFNEDCGFSACVYREHQTHFHCTRKDCGYYTFCDRSRFVQHTARHDRLDSLMGGDFQQFRSSVHCGISDCPFAAATSTSTPAVSISGGGLNSSASASAGKTTHYHCLKCAYVCADTNKVVAHRRQHDKLNSITSAGFEKYAPGQDCCSKKMRRASGEEEEEEGRGGGQEDGMEVDEEGGEGGSALSTCNYRLKQTHYHCTTCAYAVLGLTGMAAHKLKHQQQQQQQQTFSE